MKEPIKIKKNRTWSLHRGQFGHFFYAVLVVVGLFLIGAASQELMTGEMEYSAARTEYESLREQYPIITMLLQNADISAQISAGSTNPSGGLDIVPGAESEALNMDPDSEDDYTDEAEDPVSGMPVSQQDDPLAGLIEVNRDFVGWIFIEGVIDYPVVRGQDNERYLNLTFSGKYNPSGAIFMDSRNSKDFGEQVCVVYGHNMKDGSMFAPLHKYRDPSFMAEHPHIIVVTSDGEVLFYKIFAARYESALDLIGDLGFTSGAAVSAELRGAPEGANSFLILSTCNNSADTEGRLRVYAALV